LIIGDETNTLVIVPSLECVMIHDRNLVSYYYSASFVDEYIRRGRIDYAAACRQLREIAVQLIEIESDFRNNALEKMRASGSIGETLSLEQLFALCQMYATRLEKHLYAPQVKLLPGLSQR
jgi:hypothetical protein